MLTLAFHVAAALVSPSPAEAQPGDRAVLKILYHATGGPNWYDNRNWDSDAPLDDWEGVGTDDSGRVTVLDLDSNRLIGTHVR